LQCGPSILQRIVERSPPCAPDATQHNASRSSVSERSSVSAASLSRATAGGPFSPTSPSGRVLDGRPLPAQLLARLGHRSLQRIVERDPHQHALRKPRKTLVPRSRRDLLSRRDLRSRQLCARLRGGRRRRGRPRCGHRERQEVLGADPPGRECAPAEHAHHAHLRPRDHRDQGSRSSVPPRDAASASLTCPRDRSILRRSTGRGALLRLISLFECSWAGGTFGRHVGLHLKRTAS
jgi:hypothetical protein